jgi:hypothetical protein
MTKQQTTPTIAQQSSLSAATRGLNRLMCDNIRASFDLGFVYLQADHWRHGQVSIEIGPRGGVKWLSKKIKA